MATDRLTVTYEPRYVMFKVTLRQRGIVAYLFVDYDPNDHQLEYLTGLLQADVDKLRAKGPPAADCVEV